MSWKLSYLTWFSNLCSNFNMTTNLNMTYVLGFIRQYDIFWLRNELNRNEFLLGRYIRKKIHKLQIIIKRKITLGNNDEWIISEILSFHIENLYWKPLKYCRYDVKHHSFNKSNTCTGMFSHAVQLDRLERVVLWVRLWVDT